MVAVDAAPGRVERTLRPIAEAGAHCTLVPSLEAAADALRRERAQLLVLDANALPSSEGALLPLSLLDVPCVLVAQPHTAPLVLASARSGLGGDCLVGPLRLSAVKSRLEALGGPSSEPTGSRRPRTVLLCQPAGSGGRLAELLQLDGHRVVEVDEVRRAPERIRAAAVRPDVLVHVALLPFAEEREQLEKWRLGPLAHVPRVVVGREAQAPPGEPASGWVHRDGEVELLLKAIDDATRRPSSGLDTPYRVPFAAPVELSGEGFSGSALACAISRRGLFLRTLVPPRAGSVVQLRLHLAPGQVVEASGAVAWANPFAASTPWRAVAGAGLQLLASDLGALSRLRELHRTATAESVERGGRLGTGSAARQAEGPPPAAARLQRSA